MLTPHHQAMLDIVLDQIIPPTPDGRMPGAAQVGMREWLTTQAADALPDLQTELDWLDEAAHTQHGQAFTTLTSAQQQALVQTRRAADPQFMSRLALETVTCYYQHDRVLQGLGLALRAPYPQGYSVVAGDLTLLQPVRQRGKVYRDA